MCHPPQRPVSITAILLFFFYTLPLQGQGLASEKESWRYVTTPDGIKLYYRILGAKKETIVLLHGGPGQNSEGIAQDLEPLKEKYTLVIYDQRGCGRSELGDTTRINPQQHVEDLETLRNHLKIGALTLMGHSWGCLLATLYTDQYPERVKRLILISPGAPTRKLLSQRFAAFSQRDPQGQAKLVALRKQLEKAGDPAFICNEISAINDKFYFSNVNAIRKKRGDYCRVPEESIRKQVITARRTLLTLGNYDLTPQMRTIRVPALVLEGTQTPVPLGEIEVWTSTLPNSRLLWLKDCGHGYVYVEQPKLFFNAVREFMKGEWPKHSSSYRPRH